MSSQHVDEAPDPSEPIMEDIVELCDYCVKLTKRILEDPPDDHITGSIGWGFDPKITPGMCRFCEVILNDPWIRNIGVTTEFISDSDMGRRRTSKGSQYGRICSTRIERCTFAMWANPGSAACASLNDRAPILGPHMNQVGDLIQHWRKGCSNHERCTPEYDAVMPTRVLALCGNRAQSSVELVESKGQRGRYIALSHCWGSTKKRPPRTTSDNLEAHQAGIPFEDLPKTFQDVVELAQVIGIRSVWIDSLCIIQDDPQDWIAEAERMRDVYRNATLVVAASGARDSSEGLFITDRPRAKVFRLPYRKNGKIRGQFNMMQMSGQWDPKFGQLESRAWTLQERYLARRFLAFMPPGITWICQTTSRDEVGRHYSIGAEHEWFLLLREYTKRSLTVPSDRTKALRGVAAHIQRSRKQRYIAEYGVWEKKLILQLLWLSEDPCTDDLLTVPSWSWAATNGIKKWPEETRYRTHQDVEQSEEMPRRLLIGPTGHLQLFGHLSTKQLASSYVHDASTLRGLPLYELERLHDPYCMISPKPSLSLNQSFHVITQNMHDTRHQAVLGIARFDFSPTTSYTHASLLAKSKRSIAEDFGYPVATGTASVEEHTIGHVVYHIEPNPDFVYWALLLEQVSDSVFRRVGMATLLPVAYEALQVQVREFEII